jgi:hypothetical protein
MVAAPPLGFRPAARSYAAPAGKSNENAADWTPGITSATSTRPFGNVCCSIVDDATGKGTSRSLGQSQGKDLRRFI